jgi:multiple sugar transport system substrate-binding protein
MADDSPASRHERVDDDALPYGMNRREWLKYFGAGGVTAGITSLAGCAGGDSGSGGGGSDGGSGDGGGGSDGDGGGSSGETIPVPRNDDAFSDITLRWTTDNAAGPLYSMFGPRISEECGVSFNEGRVLPPDNYYSALNTEFVGGGSVPFDITLLIPLYLGDFQARGIFEPLDKYLNKYEGMQEYVESVIEPYREFYMKWNGNTVALPIDGDIHNLFYRPSFFNDSYHQEEFQSQMGRELEVPQTWPEFNEVAKYFTENTEDGVFGTQVYGARPWNFGWFMDRAASRGVIYFDENMEPQINSEDGVAALEHMVETTEYAPDNTAQLGVAETINNWQQGKVVMSVWWIDLTEFTARGDFPVVGDQSAAAVPGWEQDDGSIRRNAMMLYNRLYTVPASLPDAKKEAAFYAAMRISHPDYSMQAVADPFTGLDPFLQQHYTDEAAEFYTQSNPLRGTGEGFPKNVPIFSPDKSYPDGRSAVDQAKQHLEAGRINMENGFPQPNWPGAAQYVEDFAIHIQRALAGQESPKEALDAVADEWRTTRDELGRESQQQAYQQFIDTARELDYV